MNFIFCGASNSLLFSLYLKNVLGEDITIVTYNKNILKYCDAEKINYIEYKRIRPTKPTFKSIYELIELKDELNKVINKIQMGKDDKFILAGNNALAYDSFYLAKELTNRGRCYYKYTDKKFPLFYPPPLKPIFIRGMALQLLIKIILGLDIIFYETNKAPRMGVADTFQKKYNILEYAPKLSFEELCVEVMKKTKINYKEFDNLIIDSGPEEKIVDIDSMKQFYRNLLKLPVEFAFKPHPDINRAQSPSTESFYSIFKDCEELPSYLPVQLLTNNVKKNVISLFSASLVTVSQLEQPRAISFLELVDWHHDSYKREWKQYLTHASKNRILFPKSFEELKEILLR